MVAIFPRLDCPSLFVASPGDMVVLRHMATKIFEEVNRQGGRGASVQVYKYEDAELADTDSRPIQELICRPDDALSEGIVAFFGEKVGKDLHSGSDKSMLDDVPDLLQGIAANDKRYRLVHPWEDGAEQTGGFPLTGSTFEVLCALAGQKRLEAQASQKSLPAFICFASPADVLDADHDEDASWGNDRLWDETYERFKGQKKRLRREQDALALQRQKLANFARFLGLNGYELRFIPEYEQIEQAYRQWLRNNGLTGVYDAARSDPFVGLRSYDVKDFAAYFGREGEVQAVVNQIETIFRTPDAPRCYWVKGASGVGKSSFLRAGLIGELHNSHRVAARYSHAVFRPNQLLAKATLTKLDDPLQAMFVWALQGIYKRYLGDMPDRDTLQGYDKTYAGLTPGARGDWVLRTLDEVIARLEPEGSELPYRLVIGIDQFEEIVDMLFDDARKDQWSGFVDFMALAPTGRRVFVIATLRQRRLEKMREHPRLGPLWDLSCRHEYDLKVPSNKDLRRIMERPFEVIKHSFLSEGLLAHLLAQVNDILAKDQGRFAGRVMPLVSMVLRQIHEKVGEKAWHEKHNSASRPRDRGGRPDASADMKEAATTQGYDTTPVKITLEDAREHADLDNVIAKLAHDAMEEVRSRTTPGPQDTTLDDLLRKLVQWAGDGAEDDTQFSLPGIQMPTSGDEALIARALRKNRLLMDEGDGKVRLVHETVLRKWPEAAEFLKRERPLYRLAREMRLDARRWSKGRKIDSFQVEEFAGTACEMLGLWAHRFHTYFTAQIDPDDLMVRDYCLELMKRLRTPRATVQKTCFQTSHLGLAALYGRADIIHEMLAHDPAAVDIARSDGRTAIMTPGFVSDHKVLDALLSFGADVTKVDDDGFQPLHYAAIGGDVAFTRKLIGAGATVPESPCHPIHIAAQHGNSALMSFYLDTHGVPADIRADMGWTPLMYAAQQDECDALGILAGRADLNATSDPEAEKPYGMTALHIAAANGALAFVKAMMDMGVPLSQADRGGGTALHYAVNHDHPATARFIAHRMEQDGGEGANPKAINHWADVALHTIIDGLKAPTPEARILALADWTPLHLAVGNDDPRCLYALLDAGVKPDVARRDGKTPLMMAIAEGHVKCVNPLARVADLTLRDPSGATALQAAIRKADLTLAMEIASHDPARKFDYVHMSRVTDAQKLTMLHQAAAEDAEKITRFLLNSDLPDSLEDVFGRTPLHVAAANGQVEQLSLLLEKPGFDVFARDAQGESALDLACLAGRYRSAVALLAAAGGRDVRSLQPDLLHKAAQGGSVQIVQRLIALGYPADACDAAGLTPLMIAARQGHDEIVGWLAARADVDPLRPMQGRAGVSALTIAVCGGTEATLAHLVRNGCLASLPVKPLVWQAVEHGQFDCAACLLETAGIADFDDPSTGERLSARFAALRSRHRATFPNSALKDAARLSAILFPDGPADAPDTEQPTPSGPASPPAAAARAPLSDAPAPAPMTGPAVRPVAPAPLSGHTPTSQSRQHGLAGDLYPRFDRKNRLWQPFIGRERDDFINQIKPVDGRHPLDPDTVACHRRSLPFYDDVALIHLTDPDIAEQALAFFYLSHQGALYRLDGTSPPIHALNAKAGIKITEQNMADYLRFFCFFVRASDGPFYLIEDARDPLIPTKDPALRKVVEGTARPISLDGVTEGGSFLASGVIWYSDAIFTANFTIHQTGMIEMLDDQPVATDLPGRLNLPLS